MIKSFTQDKLNLYDEEIVKAIVPIAEKCYENILATSDVLENWAKKADLGKAVPVVMTYEMGYWLHGNLKGPAGILVLTTIIGYYLK